MTAALENFPWLYFSLAFLAGGSVKGALGVGLPLVTIPLLSFVMPGMQAIALMALPVVFSNVWQAVEGADVRGGLRRFGGLIAAQFIATVLTVQFTLSLSAEGLKVMLAGSVLLAVALMAFKPTLQISAQRERVAGVGVGALSGLLGGISSLTGPVIITYLMALRLTQRQFVSSISIIYLGGALPLYGAMAWHGRFGWTELVLSAVALVPMGVGLRLGKAVRYRLNEQIFRRVLLVFLTLLALLLIFK